MSRPAPALHEQVARIIEPQAFAFLDRHAASAAPETVSFHRERATALAKAAEILRLPALAATEAVR